MQRSVLLASLIGMLCLAFSAHAVAGPYDEHRIIRVWPETARQELAVAQLPMGLMDEAVRRAGGTAYLAPPEAVEALTAIGVPFEIVLEDVQGMVDAERARLDAREIWGVGPVARSDDSFFQEFRDFAELNTFFDQLMLAHPGLITRETIGTSIQGRGIEAFTIAGPGDADARPSFILNGTAHAREWISPMTVAYIMRGLLEGYGSDARITALLDHVTFRVAPVMNPDGYLYSWNSERYWRKNRRNNGNGTFGVDWNRNWATGWGGEGSSGSTSSDVYRGTAPFSEPETQALRDYGLSIPNAAVHIDVHSYSQLVMWPWGHINGEIPEPDRTIHEDLARAYAADIASETGASYAPIKSSDLYLAGGAASDWFYDGGGMFSFTVELRPASGGFDGFSPPPSAILPCARENFAAVVSLGETIAGGVSVSFPGGQPLVVEPRVENEVSVEIIPAFSGPLDASSALLWARIGDAGSFSPSPMSVAGDVYTGDLPAAPCGAMIEYFIEIESVAGMTYTVPFAGGDAPFSVAALDQEVAFADDMEQDLGWTVGAPDDSATTGIWERVNPEPTGAQPGEDHTPGGSLCWVTDGRAGTGIGSWDIDNGVTTLTSPRLDATGEGDAYVSYWLWYSNDQGANPGVETMPIQISEDDGQTWELLELITASTAGWEYRSHRVADVIEPTDQVRVRFRAQDFVGAIVEAAVDDFALELVGCTGNPADLAPPFGVLDLADVLAFVDAFTNGDMLADLAPPFGVLDLGDVGLFVTAFLQGID